VPTIQTYTLVEYPKGSGTKYYCTGSGELWEMGKRVFSGQGCYAYPKKLFKQIGNCCPGQTGVAGAVCGDDFLWKKSLQAACNSDMECPGRGMWSTNYKDPNRKTLFRQTCVNHQCVEQKKVTECASDLACPSDQRCYIDVVNGIGKCGKVNPMPDSPVPVVTGETGEGTNWLALIVKFFVMWLVGTIIALILIVIGAFLLPIPFLKYIVFKNFKMLAMVAVVLGLLIAFVFAMPVASLAASMFGA
jgi:hypothetical protein